VKISAGERPIPPMEQDVKEQMCMALMVFIIKRIGVLASGNSKKMPVRGGR